MRLCKDVLMKKCLILWLLCASLQTPLLASWQNLDNLYDHLKKIHLNEKQSKQIEALFKTYHENLKQWWKTEQSAQDNLIKNLSSNNFLKSSNSLKEVYDKKATLDYNFLRELHMILTKNQREEFIDILNKE